ncbi:hypothetical protein J6590_007508 [Homalodisca vitripennis]|nr:hypothetical protein J6590_007508 [Homalodisca vitripennis]
MRTAEPTWLKIGREVDKNWQKDIGYFLSPPRIRWWLIVPKLTAPQPPQLIAPQIWPECSQRQHNRINNRVHAHIATAHSATAHSATDLVECSQRQHNRINNRIHAHSATAHSATGHSATDLAGVLTAPQLIAPQLTAPHICCGATIQFRTEQIRDLHRFSIEDRATGLAQITLAVTSPRLRRTTVHVLS